MTFETYPTYYRAHLSPRHQRSQIPLKTPWGISSAEKHQHNDVTVSMGACIHRERERELN